MIKKFSTLTLGALGLVTLASACTVDMADVSQEEIGTSEEALMCSNDQATYAIMASMANAAAKELGRWNPRLDFKWNWSANNGGGGLELTTTSGNGVNKCSSASAGCTNLKWLLGLQSDAASGLQFAGSDFRPENLRNRLYSNWDRQKVCLDRPDNGMGDNCPAELHNLAYTGVTSVSATTCTGQGGKDYKYHATYASNGATMTVADAKQLKNMLIFLGGEFNTFLQFDVEGDDVKIDPADGTSGGSSGSSGSCEAYNVNPVLQTVGVNNGIYKCDATNVVRTVGSCCTCNPAGIANPASNSGPKSWKTAISPPGTFVCKP